MTEIISPYGGTFKLTEQQELKKLNTEEFLAALVVATELSPIFCQEAIRYYSEIVNKSVTSESQEGSISSEKWKETSKRLTEMFELKYEK
jgi:hypothetical protein